MGSLPSELAARLSSGPAGSQRRALAGGVGLAVPGRPFPPCGLMRSVVASSRRWCPTWRMTSSRLVQCGSQVLAVEQGAAAVKRVELS